MAARLKRGFYRRDPRVVAPELLGKTLVAPGVAGRIVEVEAYCGSKDPGSHAFRGPTKRTLTMFGPAGRLYVYFTYGMHWCANVVCDEEGEAGAVLLRAVAPTKGIDLMWARRPKAKRPRDLTAGPARLCQAFALDGTHDGLDLVAAEGGVTILDDGTPPPIATVSTRIGLSAGGDLPWRWSVAGDPNLSKPA
jgi:DNA-3-methyladenine glycosylase